MSNRWRVAAPITLLLAGSLVAACQTTDTGTTASPASTPAGSPAMSPEASPVMSPEASPSASAPASAAPSAMPTAGTEAETPSDLESVIPTTVGSVTLEVATIDPISFFVSNPTSQLVTFLDFISASPSDVEIVSASDSAGTLRIDAAAHKELDEAALAAQIQALVNAVPETPLETATVGGKEVVVIEEGAWLYGGPDAIFAVTTSDPALAEQALTALP
jgi:hypothetical protein